MTKSILKKTECSKHTRLDRIDTDASNLSKTSRIRFGGSMNASSRSRSSRFQNKFPINYPKMGNKNRNMRRSASSSTFKNNTFNTRIRLNKTKTGQLEKYQFYKEKRLLEFLTSTVSNNKRIQANIQKKLGVLMEENKDYEDERNELLCKLNDFNPL